jgi:isochorismate synthase/2-succinyl-5-enolpyruvyl-6-hydroxy-3-cyclohexene-1-carboxylate synthase/2-succinyl-6-hydroxy-2,4-cyclohexadiene-1-carboxylate synthase/O-succinylbenzoate synthase
VPGPPTSAAGIPVALDESLDEGLAGPPPAHAAAAAARRLAEAAAAAPAAASGIFGSLDESLGVNGGGGGGGSNGGRALPADAASGLGAVVIKPSIIGGYEAAWRVAEWAAARGAAAVVSCVFESSVGLAGLAQLAAAADAALAPAAAGGGRGSGSGGPASAGGFHGLGTLDWFEADAVAPGLAALSSEAAANGGGGGGLAFGVAAADRLLAGAADAATAAAPAIGWTGRGSEAAPAVRGLAAAGGGRGALHLLDVACEDPLLVERHLDLPLPNSCPGGAAARVRWLEARPAAADGAAPRRPVVLLHGFMGDASDWAPTMRALAAAGHPCLAIDLPGHGGTRPAAPAGGPAGGGAAANGSGAGGGGGFYSLDAAAELVSAAAAAAVGGGAECVLVGYSMGARVALRAVAGSSATSAVTAAGGGAAAPVWAGAVVVSGTPGIPNPEQRADRTARDGELAVALRGQGLDPFIAWWYSQPLWASLRSHPRFKATAARRAAAGDVRELAAALEGMSTGRMVGRAGRRRDLRARFAWDAASRHHLP